MFNQSDTVGEGVATVKKGYLMSGTFTCADEQAQSIFMVRQPIFTREKNIWGYELITSSVPSMADDSQATCLADFIASFKNSLSSIVGGFAPGQKIVVNITKENLTCGGSVSPDWGDCIFNLCHDAIAAPECAEFVEFVKSGGGSVALDGDAQQHAFDGLMDKSDFIRVSLTDKTPPEIVAMRKKYKDYPGQFLIQGVSDWQSFEGTRALGFDFFQGSFFAVPEMSKDKNIPASAVAKIQLMKEISNPDCEIDELTSIIASDVSLSYRILRYINSPSFGLRSEISSIQQALSLLGLKEVRHWAMVVAMSDLDASPKGEELGFRVLQRARFVSQLADKVEGFPHSSDSMFMLGLFSKLDALLSTSMDKALEDIPLDSDMRNALCGTVNDYHDWLQLLEGVEMGDWGVANGILEKYDICFGVAAAEYMKASSWTAMQLPEMKK